MPRGLSNKREQEYQQLTREFKREHRYPGREQEVAARIVNKQRKLYGETREALQDDRAGKSPDRNLPIDDYDRLSIERVEARMPGLSAAQLRKIRSYELEHKQRKGLLRLIDRYLASS